MIDELNKIVSKIDFSVLNLQKLVPPNEEVTPAVTMVDPCFSAYNLNPIQAFNIFNSVGIEKAVCLRYGINKDFAKSLVNSDEIANNFITRVQQATTDSLYRITDNNLRLTQQITLKLPGMSGFVLAREDGNYEIRVYCQVLL